MNNNESFLIKLTTRETLLCIIAESTESSVTVAFPYVLTCNKKGKIKLQKWLPCADEQIFTISYNDIVTIAETNQALNERYNQLLISHHDLDSGFPSSYSNIFGRN